MIYNRTTMGYVTRPLIVVLGPTASGKSSYAIKLAKLVGGEIICADSRTVYRGMDIGTAKPTMAERRAIPHWGLDLVAPDQRFTLYDFQQYAFAKIAEIRERNHAPMLVGGSGLYIDSVIYHYDLQQQPFDLAKRARLERLSLPELINYAKARAIDLPRDRQNKRRLVRAIEQKGLNNKSSQLDDETIVIGMMASRDELRQRSRLRAKQMLAVGLVDEVKKLVQQYGDAEPLRRNAYGVVRQYLNGDIASEDELIDRLVIADGHLVKKQLTWWRNQRRAGDIMWTTLPQLEAQLVGWQGASSEQILADLITEYKKFIQLKN